MSLITAVVQLGLSVALCVWLTWKSQKDKDENKKQMEDLLKQTADQAKEREEHYKDTIEKQATFQRETLVKLVVDSTTAIQNNTKALERIENHHG